MLMNINGGFYMEIVSISENSTLAKSKKMMFWGFLGYIILNLLVCCIPIIVVFPSISIIIALAGLVCIVVVFVGLYDFSKIANTFIFRYGIYVILLSIGYQFFAPLMLGFLGIGDIMFSDTQLYVILGIVVLLGVAILILSMYLQYKMSIEMSFLTDIKAFITSYKLYVICVVGFVLLCVAFIFMFVDFLNSGAFLVSASLFVKFMEAYRFASMILIGILLLLFCVGIVSLGFLILGLFRIEYTKVRERIK